MATGLLASSNLSSTADTVVYTAPSAGNTTVYCKIFVTNRNGSPIVFRLALGAPGDTAIGTTNSLEFDVTIPANGILERGNVMLGPNERIIARTGTAGVSVAVCGVDNQ